MTNLTKGLNFYNLFWFGDDEIFVVRQIEGVEVAEAGNLHAGDVAEATFDVAVFFW